MEASGPEEVGGLVGWHQQGALGTEVIGRRRKASAHLVAQESGKQPCIGDSTWVFYDADHNNSVFQGLFI
jgi:hypothetical protein